MTLIAWVALFVGGVIGDWNGYRVGYGDASEGKPYDPVVRWWG